jgi:hypothetical protein
MRIFVLIVIALLPQFVSAKETSLFECRKIKDIETRVACYDAIVDLLFPVATTDSQDSEVSVNTAKASTVPNSNSLFGKNAAETNRIVEETLAIKKIDQLTATVTAVTKNTYKKLTITLDNGQVWRQLDNDPLPLKKGETVVIRSARLGSFLLQKESGSGSIRVSRLD